jgi:hypothetical protein
MLGGQGKKPRGGWHIATITRLRPNRMHSSFVCRCNEDGPGAGEPARLFRTPTKISFEPRAGVRKGLSCQLGGGSGSR